MVRDIEPESSLYLILPSIFLDFSGFKFGLPKAKESASE